MVSTAPAPTTTIFSDIGDGHIDDWNLEYPRAASLGVTILKLYLPKFNFWGALRMIVEHRLLRHHMLYLMTIALKIWLDASQSGTRPYLYIGHRRAPWQGWIPAAKSLWTVKQHRKGALPKLPAIGPVVVAQAVNRDQKMIPEEVGVVQHHQSELMEAKSIIISDWETLLENAYDL